MTHYHFPDRFLEHHTRAGARPKSPEFKYQGGGAHKIPLSFAGFGILFQNYMYPIWEFRSFSALSKYSLPNNSLFTSKTILQCCILFVLVVGQL